MKFTPSPYLAALGQKYAGYQQAQDALKSQAQAGNRALTTTERETLGRIQAEAQPVYDEYTALYAAEERDAQIAQLRGSLNFGQDNGQDNGQQGGAGEPMPGQAGSLDVLPGQPGFRAVGVGGATTAPRDPGHYRSVKDGGQHSFFSDLVKAREDGGPALRRLSEHSEFMRAQHRVIDTAGEGTGIIPPKWLAAEFAELPRQGRAVANAVRNIDIGSDPRPMTLPKQTSGTDAAVAEQAAEGDSVSSTDGWDSDVDTVTPKPTAGSQIVTRQMLDMGSPATDQLIYGDLIGAYDDKIEAKVCAAIFAVGTGISAEDGTDVTDPLHYDNYVIQAAMTVKTGRKRPPSIYTMSSTRWGDVLNLRDSTGRPLVPDPQAGPMNVVGVGSVDASGRYHGLGVVDSSGYVNDDFIAAVHLPSILLFEGAMLRFRYEQPNGPEKVRLGIWAYSAVAVRYGTTAVKRVTITQPSV